MQGGAITLAKKYNQISLNPDLIIASSMLDLSSFLSLTRDTTSRVKVVTYFHENQLSYPWSPKTAKRKRGLCIMGLKTTYLHCVVTCVFLIQNFT